MEIQFQILMKPQTPFTTSHLSQQASYKAFAQAGATTTYQEVIEIPIATVPREEMGYHGFFDVFRVWKNPKDRRQPWTHFPGAKKAVSPVIPQTTLRPFPVARVKGTAREFQGSAAFGVPLWQQSPLPLTRQ